MTLLGEGDALRLLVIRRIVDAIPSPACVEFKLSDGRVLTLWDASEEEDRRWEITKRGNSA